MPDPATRSGPGQVPILVVYACQVGTIAMLALTQRWLDVAFFSFLFVVGLAWRRRRRATTRIWDNVNAGFWVLIYAAAVAQLFFPGLALAPIVLWWVRFLSVAALSSLRR